MASENEDDCSWYQLGCNVNSAVSDGIAEVAYDLLEKASEIVEWLATRWLHWSPGIDTESNAVAQIQGNLWWYTGSLAILGILIALGKMVLSNDFKSLIGVAKPIVNLIIVTGVYATGIRLLDDAGNELAIWLFEEIDSGGEGTVGMGALAEMTLMTPQGVQAAIGAALIIGLLSIIGSAVLFAFMIFRDVMLLIMLAFMPSVAASTGTETGEQAFKKMNGWLLALLLFKPVAAVIIALGITLMRDNTDISGASEDGIMRPLSGVLIVALASLALPALIKFVVPAAAVGAGAFSGGAALATGATIAGGAAVLAASAGTGGGAGAAGAGASTMSGADKTGGGDGGGVGGGDSSSTGGGGDSPSGASSAPSSDNSSAPGSQGDGGGDSPGGGDDSAVAGAASGGGSSFGGDTSSESGGDEGGGSPSSDGSAAGGAATQSSTSGTGGGGDGESSGGSAAEGAGSEGTSSGNSGPPVGDSGSSSGSSGGSSGGGLSASDAAVVTQTLGDAISTATGSAEEAAEGK